MRFVFFTAILFAGYFIVFNMFPTDSEVLFASFSGQGTVIDGVAAEPNAPMINRKTEGGKLFLENCARCHSTNLKKDLTGPALWGVGDRVERDVLAAWIKNSAKVIESGEAYFIELQKEYNGAAMDPMPHLKPEQIEAIIDEITMEST